MKNKKKKKKSKKNTLPTTVEIFMGMGSEITVSAFMRSGAGFHSDKRDRKARKHEWKQENWE
jgi:hypothetical protein